MVSVTHAGHGDNRRSHALTVRIGAGLTNDPPVRFPNGFTELVERGDTSGTLLDDGRHSQGTRYLTGEMAAHAVGDNEDVTVGMDAVLVLQANASGIRPRSPAKGRFHHAVTTRISVVPAAITSPAARVVGALIMLPLTRVPLVEPRSRTTTPPL